MSVLRHLLEEAIMRGKKAWNPDDPLGMDPDVIAAHRQKAAQNPFLRPVQQFNESAGYPATALADALLRGGNAALHGGATLAGQGWGAATGQQGMGRRLTRDLLGMAQMSTGGVGRFGGVAAQGQNAAGRVREVATSRQFVRGADGSIQLGRIGPEVEQASGGRFPQGPIRMQQGLSGPDGFGARHISPDKHQRAQKIGYTDGIALAKDVARNYDVVIEQRNGRLMLVKKERQNRYAIAERRNGGLERFIGKGKPYYGVTTAFPGYPRKAKPGKISLEKALNGGGIKLWEEGS